MRECSAAVCRQQPVDGGGNGTDMSSRPVSSLRTLQRRSHFLLRDRPPGGHIACTSALCCTRHMAAAALSHKADRPAPFDRRLRHTSRRPYILRIFLLPSGLALSAVKVPLLRRGPCA
jgi:hypothetical protein